mgnify:CR=1 FL=1
MFLERKYSREKKKEFAPYLAREFTPRPRSNKHGIRFTNQRRGGDKKEDRRPEEDHGQEGASFALSRGSFFHRIPISFCSVIRCIFVSVSLQMVKIREKNATKNKRPKSATSLCDGTPRRAFAPKPALRRRQTRASNAGPRRECIGARFYAAREVARRSRGFPAFEKSKEVFFASQIASRRERTITEKNQGKKICWSILIFFFRLKKEAKRAPKLPQNNKADHIFFFHFLEP